MRRLRPVVRFFRNLLLVAVTCLALGAAAMTAFRELGYLDLSPVEMTIRQWYVRDVGGR
ncbi:MAG: hypothetical protein LIP77_08370 [Planctomycetes bacterium]|nr:hypothetical protein [Planctomycetota bacterium]